MGNIIPESMTMGISSTIADKRSATSCVFATLETSKPNERAKRMYIVEIRKYPAQRPLQRYAQHENSHEQYGYQDDKGKHQVGNNLGNDDEKRTYG